MAESIIDIPVDALVYSTYSGGSSSPSGTSIPSNAWTIVGTETLAKGIWLVNITVGFASSTSVVKKYGVLIRTTSESLPADGGNPVLSAGIRIAGPTSASAMYITYSRLIKVDAAQETFNLAVYHDDTKAVSINAFAFRKVCIA